MSAHRTHTGRYEITENGQAIVWQGPESFNLSRVISRWSLPPDPYTDAELGSGISWALGPTFCREILGLFPEENVGSMAVLLDCNALRSAVARSFDTWASNHKKLYFVDVTEQCEQETGDECDAAEVYILPDRDYSAANDLAAFVSFKVNEAGTLFNPMPYTTAGRPGEGYGIQGAVMKVRPHGVLHSLVVLHPRIAPRPVPVSRPPPLATVSQVRVKDICWYLDATFCYYFSSLDSSFDIITVSATQACALPPSHHTPHTPHNILHPTPLTTPLTPSPHPAPHPSPHALLLR